MDFQKQETLSWNIVLLAQFEYFYLFYLKKSRIFFTMIMGTMILDEGVKG